MPIIHIEQIRPELTWKLRHEVLYTEGKLANMAMDEDADGYHFAAFKNNYIVAVVSLFNKGDSFQFRKFAVAPMEQRSGIGSSLLNYITTFAQNEGAKT